MLTQCSQSNSSQAFVLSFHLPFMAWRQSTMLHYNTRPGPGNSPLRASRELSPFSQASSLGCACLHEAQISCMISGLDNRHWTGYGFFDTCHDGEESRHDIRSYQATKGGFVMNLLTCGTTACDAPIWTAREYFLQALEARVEGVTEEWKNTGRNLLKVMKTHVSEKTCHCHSCLGL